MKFFARNPNPGSQARHWWVIGLTLLLLAVVLFAWNTAAKAEHPDDVGTDARITTLA